MSESEKVASIRALGKLGSPKAIDYLLENHDFTVFPTTESGLAVMELQRTPCLEALADVGIAAVPKAVEAYITLPAERWPEGLLHHFLLCNDRKRARVAYVYAQGFLFANKENGHHRDAVLELIRHAGGLVAHEDLPYPPPWMSSPPEK